MQFLDVTTSLDLVDGKLLVGHHQDIDSRFLDDLAEARLASAAVREREFMKVASIPAAIVDSWAAQGFNILDQRISVTDILQRLNAEDMGRLIATAKRV